MAEVAYTLERTGSGDLLVKWDNVTESDTFQRYQLRGAASEISVHIKGTFGGATAVINGANDDSAGVDLQSMDATDISATAEMLKSILQRPLYIQPAASGGSSQSLDVYMMIRR